MFSTIDETSWIFCLLVWNWILDICSLVENINQFKSWGVLFYCSFCQQSHSIFTVIIRIVQFLISIECFLANIYATHLFMTLMYIFYILGSTKMVYCFAREVQSCQLCQARSVNVPVQCTNSEVFVAHNEFNSNIWYIAVLLLTKFVSLNRNHSTFVVNIVLGCCSLTNMWLVPCPGLLYILVCLTCS